MRLTKSEIGELVASVPFWFHSLDLGDGIVTPGHKSRDQLDKEWRQLSLPELRGATVLDINCWDGFFAFEAEKLGATSVTALDYYMWAMDLGEHTRYWRKCQEKNIVPKQYHEMPYFKPAELPGKRGFDVTRQVLGSKVKEIVGDFMTMDVSHLGTFDIVLFLGTLYHMKDPLGSLERLAAVTKRLAVIETEAIAIAGFESRSMCEFFGSNELNGDVSNWWSPNEKALVGMCRAAGFKRVDVQVSAPSLSWPSVRFNILKRPIVNDIEVKRYRAVVHAWR